MYSVNVLLEFLTRRTPPFLFVSFNLLVQYNVLRFVLFQNITIKRPVNAPPR